MQLCTTVPNGGSDAFDAEAGGVLVCAGDASLLQHLRTTYERACKDTGYLKQLIAAVPDEAWDD